MGQEIKIDNEFDLSLWKKSDTIVFTCPKCKQKAHRRADHLQNSIKKFGRLLCGACGLKEPRTYKTKQQGKPITIICKYCKENFTVPFGQRKRIFCSKKCSLKSKKGLKDSRVKSICKICNKEFLHYGVRIVCSTDCNARLSSVSRIGKNNPHAKTHPSVYTYCRECESEFSYTKEGLHVGQERVFCSKECSSKFQTGKTKGTWEPTDYKDPYPKTFNKKLKEQIKKRDNYQCKICCAKENLHIHHIDRDKNNITSSNLISLCNRCHRIAHTEEMFFETIISTIISGSTIVQKGWGIEGHIVNHKDYCLKYLVFFKGKQFSLHHHDIKKELWHCLVGKFICDIADKQELKSIVFNKGDKIEIVPGVAHQLTALQNSVIVEVSTTDYPEDSIRWIKGD